jgi:hypothetical protein
MELSILQKNVTMNALSIRSPIGKHWPAPSGSEVPGPSFLQHLIGSGSTVALLGRAYSLRDYRFQLLRFESKRHSSIPERMKPMER